MWQQIESNKRKSLLVLALMSIFFMAFALCISYAITRDIMGILLCNIICYLIFIGIFIYSYRKPLSSFGDSLYKYSGEGDRTLYDIVSEMKIASGLTKMPEIYILDSNILNAFACGTSEKNAKIIVSKGLLKALNRDELQGVIAHEIAHIINRDTCYLLFASIIVNITANLARSYLRGRRRGTSRASQADLIIIVVAIIFAIIAPILANLFYFFISRKREYLADACSAQYTRYPMGLASALKKISSEIQKSSNNVSMSEFNGLASPLAKASFIVPLKLSSEGDGLFSTHPSTKNRISILLNMANMGRADFSSYNSVYKKVTGSDSLAELSGNEKAVISSREPFVEEPDISTIQGNINSEVIGFVSGSGAAQSIDNSVQIQKKEIDKEIEKYRKVEDVLWSLSDYITIDCPCGTKLRLPQSYKGQTILCPHCKKEHKIY